MNTPINQLVLILCLLLVLLSNSCIDKQELVNINNKDLLLSQLSTEHERKFFDYNYIVSKNSNIKPSIQPRGSLELIDSLFNHLVSLQLSDPYAENLIEQIGYPIWIHAKVSEDDTMPFIIVPFTKEGDFVTEGVLFNTLWDGVWHSIYVTRDTLNDLLLSTNHVDENIPSYLAATCHFDNLLFSHLDTTLLDLYHNIEINFQSNGQITYRFCIHMEVTSCWVVDCPRAFTEDEIVVREPCTECEVTSFYTGSGCISEGGGGGGAAVGSSLGGGGGGGGGDASCGTAPNLIPYLCNFPPDSENYSQEFRDAYRDLIPHLHKGQHNWLLANATHSYMEDLVHFIHNHSPNYSQNRQIVRFWQYYKEKNGAMIFPNFVNLLDPYIANINNTETGWIEQNIAKLNDSGIEDLLAVLGSLNFYWYPDISLAHTQVLNHPDVDLFVEILSDPNVDDTDFTGCIKPFDFECMLDEINWFHMPLEGKDYEFDEEFWENHDPYPAQQRPTWAAFESNYPEAETSGAVLYGEVGGDLEAEYLAAPSDFANTCALRLSIALNKCGIVIQNIPGSTIKGDNDKYYFVNARAM